MKRNQILTVALVMLAAVACNAFAVQLPPELALGAMCLGTVGDLAGIQAAIEASNRAFEEFKNINDKRLEKMEKGQGGADELKASMEKAFKDMEDQKAVIETLEAKLKRPLFGGDG